MTSRVLLNTVRRPGRDHILDFKVIFIFNFFDQLWFHPVTTEVARPLPTVAPHHTMGLPLSMRTLSRFFFLEIPITK